MKATTRYFFWGLQLCCDNVCKTVTLRKWQEYIWGDADSLWTEMVRGKDICPSKLNYVTHVRHPVEWAEIPYPIGADKHKAVVSPQIKIGHVTADVKYMNYRTGDYIGEKLTLLFPVAFDSDNVGLNLL